MEVRELRIGNIVSLKNGYNTELPKYGKVTQVYMNGFTVDYHWPDEWFEPVELTPDILEAAGFTNGIKTIETSFLETEFYVDLMDGDAGFNKHGLWFPCKHLHQLQNLYWCLCGQELQIDLTKLNK